MNEVYFTPMLYGEKKIDIKSNSFIRERKKKLEIIAFKGMYG